MINPNKPRKYETVFTLWVPVIQSNHGAKVRKHDIGHNVEVVEDAEAEVAR